MKYLVIDTETTGLDSKTHELLSLGAIVMIDNIITDTIHVKIKPQNIDKADPKALQVNGYTPYRWKDAIDPQYAVSIIKHFFLLHQDAILVGHNVGFDIRFLHEFAFQHKSDFMIPSTYIDTRDVCRVNLAPYGCSSMSLDNVCQFLGWKRRQAHTALSDCEDCIKILRSMCPPTTRFIARLHVRSAIQHFKRLINE